MVWFFVDCYDGTQGRPLQMGPLCRPGHQREKGYRNSHSQDCDFQKSAMLPIDTAYNYTGKSNENVVDKNTLPYPMSCK
jgi:hypothetical protein